jgi:hypothetical protein
MLLELKEPERAHRRRPPERDEGEFATWRCRDKKSMASIELSLIDALLENVREASTVKAMWTFIINVFERHALLNKLSARRNFYTARILDGEKILPNRIRQLAAALKIWGSR